MASPFKSLRPTRSLIRLQILDRGFIDHKVPQQERHHSQEHHKQHSSNTLELHFTLCTFLQIDIAVLWGELQHLNNPEAWWMTNTTRKLCVQKDILATTHHQDCSQYAAKKQQRHLWLSLLSLFFWEAPRLWFQLASSSTTWRSPLCSQAQLLRRHSILLCKPLLVQVYPVPPRTASTTMQKATSPHHFMSNCLSWEFNHLTSSHCCSCSFMPSRNKNLLLKPDSSSWTWFTKHTGGQLGRIKS